MKKKLFLGLFGMTLCLLPNNVLALNASVNVSGSDTVNVGENFKISVSINDVMGTNDGIESFSGQVSYDRELLEYIGVETNNSNYDFLVNEDNLKLAALDYTMARGIKEDTIIYTFTFRAKSTGNTSISIDNLKVTDSKSYLDVNVNSLNFSIINKPTTTAKSNISTRVIASKTFSKNAVIESTTLTTETTTSTSTTIKANNVEIKKNEKQTLVKSIKNAISDFINKIKNIFRA
ncbi:MAG: hypothetical protein J5982_02015 [Bacilli bacterium]|nr:hypothetical protein [Bacilli bacterium]